MREFDLSSGAHPPLQVTQIVKLPDDKKPKPRRYRLDLTSAILSALSVLIGLISLREFLPLWSAAAYEVARTNRAAWLVVLLVVVCLIGPMRRRLESFVHRKWMAFCGLHRNQAQAHQDCSCYRDSLIRHWLLLGLTCREVAEKTALGIWRIRFFRLFPCFVPARPYLGPLADALLIPVGHFQREMARRYTARLTEKRLERFIQLGIATYTADEIRRSSPSKNAALLAAVEKQRSDELEAKGEELP
ncbi:MAG: hypothetical protein GY719_29050 [bacterium]|nr:hypothetical protein [bacterium]